MMKLIILLLPILILENVNGMGFFHHRQTRSVTHSKRYYPGYPTNLNASAVYDTDTEKCCRGNVHPKSRLEECCGETTFRPDCQRCCDGVAHEIQLGFLCCGNTTYDTKKQICCDTYAIDSSDAANPNVHCCDKATYDMTKQKCSVLGNTSTVVDISEPNTECCGPESYNPDTHECCTIDEEEKYAIRPTTEGQDHQCCGLELIDSATQGCCGNISYVSETHTCCYGTEPYSLAEISKPGETLCCGSSGKAYNPYTQMCCGDEIQDNPDSNLSCCGNFTYNTDEAICSWGENDTKPVNKTSPEHNSCCGDVSYDYSKHICCGDQLTEQTTEYDMQCCGEESYNTTSQTCCWDYDSTTSKSTNWLIDDFKPSSFCCGKELYTYGSNKGCCNGKIYDTKDEVCCENKIINKNGKDGRTTCCYEDDHANYMYGGGYGSNRGW